MSAQGCLCPLRAVYVRSGLFIWLRAVFGSGLFLAQGCFWLRAVFGSGLFLAQGCLFGSRLFLAQGCLCPLKAV